MILWMIRRTERKEKKKEIIKESVERKDGKIRRKKK